MQYAMYSVNYYIYNKCNTHDMAPLLLYAISNIASNDDQMTRVEKQEHALSSQKYLTRKSRR